nr:2Fe-2S iron-sulfur cluster-binding protein [Lancefieldella rimae]
MVEEVERYTFTVNGKTVTTTENKSLLRFLRDDLHLLSVKDGCSQGACGTCTVVIDGVATRGLCYEYQTRKRQGHRDR